MNSKMYDVVELGRLIGAGKGFLVAGDEALLRKLPRGNWIGGTIPYFMSENGGTVTREKVFATELPDYVVSTAVQVYDDVSIKNVYLEAPSNGFSVVILPATSSVHLAFALNAPNFEEFASRPLVGWVSGVHLNDLGKVTPKVFNGKTAECFDDEAVVMRAVLGNDRVCDLGIVNIFAQGHGDTLEFPEANFSAREVLVNGKRTNFAEYIQQKKIDLKLPLVADYGGANINISFQGVDEKSGVVNFYAPVFKGVKYRQAAPIKNYVADFVKNIPGNSDQILFSCNCILNFLYSELEGKKTGNITGPITFGEVAYQLLNQTMVYLTIQKI